MHFGVWLRKERLKRGMTGATLAQRAGVSQAYISNLETGLRHSPTLSIAAQITSGLGIPLWVAVKELQGTH